MGSTGDPVDPLTLLAPLDVMRFDGSFSAAQLVQRTGAPLDFDLDDDGINDRVDLRIEGTVDGTQTLETELGGFSNAAAVHYEVSGTLRGSRGDPVMFRETVARGTRRRWEC